MRPEELLGLLRATPFRPFRLVMNSNRTYEIRHPEMARVTRSALLVFYADPPDGPAESYDTVSLLLIERLEFLDAVPHG